MSASGRINLGWAAALIDELVRGGVCWFVIAPGSRSTPLVLAVHEHPQAQTVVHLDERSAAFLALGVGKASGTPAAVITTSGTAAANLLPAAVEAAQSQTPLILLTADRPTRLIGGDANQAIEQRGLFGNYPKASFDPGAVSSDPVAVAYMRQIGARAAAMAATVPQGLVHVNVPFEKPLEPAPLEAEMEAPDDALARISGSPFTRVLAQLGAAPPSAISQVAEVLRAARRLLVVAGPSSHSSTAGRAALMLADRCASPLIADPLSGARFVDSGSESRHNDHADIILGDPDLVDALLPDVIVRFGPSPTSKTVNDLCARVGRTVGGVLTFDEGGRWKDHGATVSDMVIADPAATVGALCDGSELALDLDPEWAASWSAATAAAREEVRATWAEEPFEATVAQSAVRSIPKGGALFVSSSMPIRDVDAFVTADDFCGPAFGNRGASGIDGITSTALGVALTHGRPTLCLTGDVAFLHDVGGLLATRSVDSPVVFVVINNDGGGIFQMLPIVEHEPAFTEFFATPHGLTFEHAAALYGLPYAAVMPQDLERVSRDAFAAGGTHILEVAMDRSRNRELRSAAKKRVQQAALKAVLGAQS